MNRLKNHLFYKGRKALRLFKKEKQHHPVPASHTTPVETFGKVVMFYSEFVKLAQWILDSKDKETGGQLFGYRTEEGDFVIMSAIGPGPGAERIVAFFRQDKEYLLSEGTRLNEMHGLRHIGEWHSHHKLGLDGPSRHDEQTMNTVIRNENLGRFLLCIGTCTDVSASLKFYMCDGNGCYQIPLDIINDESPINVSERWMKID